MVLFKKWRAGAVCELLPTLDDEQTARYRRFRRLLEHNRTALTLRRISNSSTTTIDLSFLRWWKVRAGSCSSRSMVWSMPSRSMTGKEYQQLYSVLRSIERAVNAEWSKLGRTTDDELSLPLYRIGLGQAGLVGAKAANIGHISGELKLLTPEGFAVTTSACREFLLETGLVEQIRDTLLAELVDDEPAVLETMSRAITDRITAPPPAHQDQKGSGGCGHDVCAGTAAGSQGSAIGEDGDISFAGQYTSVLDVPLSELAQAYRQVIAESVLAIGALLPHTPWPG